MTPRANEEKEIRREVDARRDVMHAAAAQATDVAAVPDADALVSSFLVMRN